MRVVQINCSSSGSTGNIAKAIHTKLIEDGNESYIFFGGGKGNKKDVLPISSRLVVRIHSFLSRVTGLQGYFSYFPTKRLISRIKKINPNIIHLHNLHGSYLCLPVLFRFLKKQNKLGDQKLIITLHDCWIFTGKCPHFTRVQCFKWKSECGKCPQLSIYPRSLFLDCSKKMYRDKKRWLSGFNNIEIVAVSDWLKKTAEQSFLGRYKITRIYNGIDEKKFYPRNDLEETRRKYGFEDEFIILGIAANWELRKGLKDFYRLAEVLESGEKIMLVGLTMAQIEELPKNIIGITATKNQEELAQIYSMANVFINMSIEETFGLVTAEAMACGTSVIAYDSTACGEIVSAQNGVVFPPHSIDLIRTEISRIKLEQPHKEKLVFVYSSIEMVMGYLEVYKR